MPGDRLGALISFNMGLALLRMFQDRVRVDVPGMHYPRTDDEHLLAENYLALRRWAGHDLARLDEPLHLRPRKGVPPHGW